MSDRIECRYHGRDFTEGEMALLRKLIAGPPALNRHTLSKEFCRRIGWLKPDGGLKDMMARVTMLAMHGDGLILPWIRIPNLGSHILALVRRRLPRDWTRRYNTTPVLVETFVEVPRFTGGLYRASGWIRVGTTKGRGRYDTAKQYGKPTKDVWLCPLAKHWRRTLNR